MIKSLVKYGFGCFKRLMILIVPLFFMSMLLMDILTTGHYHYPGVLSLLWLKILGALFYGIALWIIFVVFNKLNACLFCLTFCLIIGFIYFDPNLNHIYQHDKCIDGSLNPCPIPLK